MYANLAAAIVTRTAIKKFLDAFAVDVASERQRQADHLKAEADRAVAEAEEAIARAAEKSS